MTAVENKVFPAAKTPVNKECNMRKTLALAAVAALSFGAAACGDDDDPADDPADVTIGGGDEPTDDTDMPEMTTPSS